MYFIDIANLFESLEKRNKRLDKILLLRDFYLRFPKETPLIFDVIAQNFQREISKKTIGISLKTIFSVLAFVSKVNENDIEKKFNRIGDIGVLAQEILIENKQSSLFSNKLNFEDIINSFKNISKTNGTNSNKIKKEFLSKLFLSANNPVEYKFLARLLIDDLRIGVSIGVLKEACVNIFFPKILFVHKYCKICDYFNLNNEKCIICSKKIEDENQEEFISKKYKLLEIDTPKEDIGLEEFIGKYSKEDLVKFMLRVDKEKYILKNQNPREIYKQFISIFEKKYNVNNSFSDILPKISENLAEVLNCEIQIGKPILSMLGTRSNNIEDSFNISQRPAFIDFKYDGLRVQIHNNLGEVKLFSRNLDDITKQFPEIVDFIKINFSDKIFVLDTECVGFNFDKMEFLPFQMLSKRILSKNFSEVSHIKVVVKAFDIMKIDNKTLIDESYQKRREILENLFLNKKIKQKISFEIEKLKKINQNFEY